MKEFTWKAILTALAAGACALWGRWDISMTTLVILISLDIASGWLRAFIQKKLSSKESLRGTFRKVLIFVIIAVAQQIDVLLGSEILRRAVTLFYCASEGLSVLENVVAAGLPVPEALKEALQQLNEKKYVER